MTLESKLKISTWIGCLLIAIISFSIGNVTGYLVREKSHVCPGIIKIAKGYTKIAFGKGIDGRGDTVKIFEYADLNIKH